MPNRSALARQARNAGSVRNALLTRLFSSRMAVPAGPWPKGGFWAVRRVIPSRYSLGEPELAATRNSCPGAPSRAIQTSTCSPNSEAMAQIRWYRACSCRIWKMARLVWLRAA